jgi:class 3 adenylate cyclase
MAVEPDETSSHRTWLCSVLFLDVVNFSSQPVTVQMTMKEHLNQLIAGALEHVAESNRIILDTGDGAALCFTGDPEDALFAALHLRDAIRAEAAQGSGTLELRMGINLGPAKLVRDVNGRQNVIGDGINAAQRVMGFAAPNQILVSRSYYEVIACLSEEYAALFHYQGQRQDKHVRQYTLYEVSVVPSAPPALTPEENRPSALVAEGARDDSPPEGAAVPMAATATSAEGSWDPGTLRGVEQHLAVYLGPVAKVLVRRLSQRTSSLSALYQTLASEIADPVARQSFLSRAADAALRRDAGSRPAPAVEVVAVAPQWDPGVLESAERCLAVYLGPVAKALVKRAGRLSTGPEDLYQRLCAELSSESERSAFLRAVHGR